MRRLKTKTNKMNLQFTLVSVGRLKTTFFGHVYIIQLDVYI